jgi:hypothetical protein
MKETGLLSEEDYSHATAYSERPNCDGLVEYDFKTPETKAQEKRSRLQAIDVEKEERRRRREKQRGNDEKSKTHRP